MTFKTGTYKLNTEPNFNFQLNRTIMWSNGDINDIKPISKNITSAESWVDQMTLLADKTLQKNRVEQAIAYYRMAEFFMFDGDPHKIVTYRKARDLFYDYYSDVFKHEISIKKVKYENGHLPVWVSTPTGDIKDTIVIHGGNDSYIEEFLPIVLYLREAGFAVYLFEGPGQGEVLREHGIPFTYKWEKPVKKLLDHFNLDDVTIIGISLGGVLAPRAAAFDKRIKRVVAWSILPNFLDVLLSSRKPFLQKTIKFLLNHKFKKLVNFILKMQMDKDPMAKWGIEHGMHNMGVSSPFEYLKNAGKFQIFDIAPLIQQDFLLLAAQKDHFIPLEMYKNGINALKNVKSLTFRIFTEKENGENHCNAGNTQLAINTIINWILSIKKIDNS